MNTVIALTIAAATMLRGANMPAREALCAILNAVGNDCENTEVADITANEAFMAGLDASDFDTVESAAITLEASEDGSVKCVIISSASKEAKKIFEKLWKSYEFPACDNAEKIIFLKAGRAVAFFKGTGTNVDAYARAFGDIFGAQGMKVIKNPAKIRWGIDFALEVC